MLSPGTVIFAPGAFRDGTPKIEIPQMRVTNHSHDNEMKTNIIQNIQNIQMIFVFEMWISTCQVSHLEGASKGCYGLPNDLHVQINTYYIHI